MKDRLSREKGAHVACLTLAGAAASLKPEAMGAVREDLLAAQHDPRVRAIVILSDGDDFATTPGAGHAALQFDLPTRPTKPVIAAIRGACLNLGLAFVARVAHVRIAAHDARFGFPDMHDGAFDAALQARLERPGVYRLARRLALTGDVIAAPALFDAGFLTDLADAEAVTGAALDWASRFCALAPLAVQGELSALAAMAAHPYEQGKDIAFAHTNLSLFDDDSREGLLAFAQKREPRFAGAAFLSEQAEAR